MESEGGSGTHTPGGQAGAPRGRGRISFDMDENTFDSFKGLGDERDDAPALVVSSFKRSKAASGDDDDEFHSASVCGAVGPDHTKLAARPRGTGPSAPTTPLVRSRVASGAPSVAASFKKVSKAELREQTRLSLLSATSPAMLGSGGGRVARQSKRHSRSSTEGSDDSDNDDDAGRTDRFSNRSTTTATAAAAAAGCGRRRRRARGERD